MTYKIERRGSLMIIKDLPNMKWKALSKRIFRERLSIMKFDLELKRNFMLLGHLLKRQSIRNN